MTLSDQTPSVLPGNFSSPEPETWIASPVDTSIAHFEIRYGDFMGSDDPLVPIARVGQVSGELFNVELIAPCTGEQMAELLSELHQFLVGNQKDQEKTGSFSTPWDYLTYHAKSTAANLYGDWHWVYIDPDAPPMVEMPVIDEETPSLWRLMMGFFRD
jgi:hypothetical protein